MQPLNDHRGSKDQRFSTPIDSELDSRGLFQKPSGVARIVHRAIRSFRATRPLTLLKNRAFQVSVLTVIGLAGGSFMLSQPDQDRGSVVASLSSQAGFEASKLVINGNKNIELSILKQKLATQLGGSLFDFNVDEARQHIMSSSWIKNAEIRKVYPDTVVVDLFERVPVALWKSDGVVNLISAEGNVIAEADLAHMRLPQVVGQGANNDAAEFLSYINQFQDITANARAYVRVADRRWNIHLNNGPIIMLPEHGWKVALNEVNELNFKKQLFERDILHVDMRLPDRLVLKMSPEQAELRKTAIEEALKKKWHKI